VPNYSRSYLGRYLRKMFEEDIERELRQLEDYVLDADSVDPSNVGENLIADVLGPDAPYSKFTPIANTPAPQSTTGDSDGLKATDEFRHGMDIAGTQPPTINDLPTPPAAIPPPARDKPAPRPRTSSGARPAARDPQQARRVPAPPAAPDIHSQKTMIIDRKTGKPVQGRQKPRWPGSPGGRDPRDLDPAIHDAPTKIIRPGSK